MKSISMGILCLALSFPSFADHLQGGEIRYEHVSGNDYNVIVDVYTGCGFTALADSDYVNIDGPASYSSYAYLHKTHADTIAPYCPGVTTQCTGFSGYPATVVSHYEGIVTLPATTGAYKFWYMSSSLTMANNISGFSNPLYLEAMVDNTLGGNSSAYVANRVGGFIGQSDTSAVPFYALDPEKDSTASELIVPQGYSGVNVTYVPGYSLTNPFGTGSICYLQNSVLHMKGTVMGNSFISVRTRDFRGGTLVGYTTRMMNIYVLGATTPTIPLKSSSTSLTSTTCAGNSNSLTFTFDDPTATDSVFININPPSISGFTFTTSTTPGIGSGSATISWTTPLSVTPASLPYFYIHANVRDNECDTRGQVRFAHIVYVGNCPVDSVWPGDANADKVVNLLDPLYIAIAWGQTGPARPAASTAWIGQYCAPWASSFPGGVNMKHADGNGDGTVGLADLAPVISNFGLTHAKGTDQPHSKQTGLPDLYFDVKDVELVPGSTVTMPLVLGNTATPMNNIYGIAARIKIDGITLNEAPVFSYANTWLGDNSNTLTFGKNVNASVTDWAFARNDQQNISGQGTLATITFKVPEDAKIGTKVTLAISDEKMIDKNGTLITAFNVIDNSKAIQFPSGINKVSNNMFGATVTPNPSNGSAVLNIMNTNNVGMAIQIVDVAGRTVWNSTNNATTISLPADVLKAGTYFIHIGNGQQTETITWVNK